MRRVLVQPVVAQSRASYTQLEDEIRAILRLRRVWYGQEPWVCHVDEVDRLIEVLSAGKLVLPCVYKPRSNGLGTNTRHTSTGPNRADVQLTSVGFVATPACETR